MEGEHAMDVDEEQHEQQDQEHQDVSEEVEWMIFFPRPWLFLH